MDLIPLESNLHKYDLVIISQIINMIETDGVWHHKMFESVLSDLRNMWTEGIHELEIASVYCTNNAKNNAEMDGIEVINLCSVSENRNEVQGKGTESTEQESHHKMKPDTTDRKRDKFRTKKSKTTTKNEEVKVTMMCWEATNNFLEEEPHKEPEKVEKKPIKKTETPKHEEDIVEPTLNIVN